MNLKPLFEMQRKLDERIVKEHRLEEQDLLPNKILALQVELGELANEWQGFKHWKVNPQPKEKMLEEYVDCLHFILSIGLELEPNIIEEWTIPSNFERFEYTSDITEYFNLLFGSWNGIENRQGDEQPDYYFWTFAVFLELGHMLGFTWDQIERAYMEKNRENHNRQDRGY